MVSRQDDLSGLPVRLTCSCGDTECRIWQLAPQMSLALAEPQWESELMIEILRVQRSGGASDEYVSFKVIADCDVGEYLVTDKTFDEGGDVSNKLRHVYWFPHKNLKKGELIILRTRKGSYSRSTVTGAVVHNFYWNLGVGVWNDKEADAAILMKVTDRKAIAAT